MVGIRSAYSQSGLGNIGQPCMYSIHCIPLTLEIGYILPPTKCLRNIMTTFRFLTVSAGQNDFETEPLRDLPLGGAKVRFVSIRLVLL